MKHQFKQWLSQPEGILPCTYDTYAVYFKTHPLPLLHKALSCQSLIRAVVTMVTVIQVKKLHVCYRWAVTSWSTQMNTDGSHKLRSTHHAANLLSATKNTVTTALWNRTPHNGSLGICWTSVSLSSRQPPCLLYRGADKSLARPYFPMHFVWWWEYFVWCSSCYTYK
jgi:hypothetical protein